MMKVRSLRIETFLLLIGLFVFASACAKSGSIEFKGDRAPSSTITKPLEAQQLDVTNGGMLHYKTSNNYQVDLSFGAKTNQIQATTTNGYKVRMNIQGEISQ